jgi:ATPase subunit of ABC transporter with duplicated ATPase domains
MIMGSETPDGGELVLGSTVRPMCVDQSRDSLDPTRSAFDEICGAGGEELTIGDRKIPVRAYLAWFNFKGADQQKRVGDLSGGERNRLHLAKTLLQGGNLLLLDEPSNDLDTDTLQCLEQAIENFNGCTVIISHDRWMLERLATHILAFEGDSRCVWFEGGYLEYAADLKKRSGGADPAALKFRPMPALS